MKLIDMGALLAEMPTIETEYKYARKIILEQPVIYAEPVRHGTWIEGKAKNIKTGEVRLVRKCSECESGYFIYDFLNSVSEIPRYCPYCGAKMRREKE